MDFMSIDESLLLRLKGGESEAYEWLVSQFEGPLFRFFVFEHRDYHLAQEQTSETFIQLVRSLPKMKGHAGQLRAFVFSIAKHVKLRQWRQPKATHPPLEECEEICDPRPSPADQAEHREQVERVLRVIGRFEPAIRDVLLFRLVEGFSLDEVAGLVELPLGTVKSHLHRGIARLKKTLAESGEQL
jgi:RNA polymerase sigma factor (sigma-70 family)